MHFLSVQSPIFFARSQEYSFVNHSRLVVISSNALGSRTAFYDATIVLAVVYTSLEMNLTAKANIATDQIPHNCFTIVFSWTLPRTAGNSSQTTNLSLQYSDSDNHTGKIILDSDTNTYVLNSSAHYLQSTTRYTFWLVLVLDLQNGTVEHVTSFPTDVTTPSCSGSFQWFLCAVGVVVYRSESPAGTQQPAMIAFN